MKASTAENLMRSANEPTIRQQVIAAKVANALALDWPRELLEVVVCSDGSDDATVAAARAAGADVVLDLPWAGKVRAQDAGAQAGRGELLAFSDANVLWEPGALAALAGARPWRSRWVSS